MQTTLRQLAAELLRDAELPEPQVGPGSVLSFAVEDGEAVFEWSDEGYIAAYLINGSETVLDLLTAGSEDDPDKLVDMGTVQKNGNDESLREVMGDFREAVSGRRPLQGAAPSSGAGRLQGAGPVSEKESVQ
jgi:hypothetical protein